MLSCVYPLWVQARCIHEADFLFFSGHTETPVRQVSSLSDTTSCAGERLVLTARDNMVSYLWSTDLTTQSIEVFPTVDTLFWVEMVDINDSIIRDSINVTVNPIPLILSSSQDTITMNIGNDTIVWVDVEVGSSILWNTGSSEKIITVNPVEDTKYTVVVSNEAGCTVRKSFLVQVMYFVDIEFSYDTICFGDSTTLINTTQTNDSITAILWDLDSDGQFDDATGDTVRHLFVTSGFHLVGMRIYFLMSGMDATYNAVPVGSIPLVDFEFENACQNTTTNFTNLTVVTTGVANSWLWYFGDGKSDFFANTSNYYTNPGIYDVQLIVESNLGCISDSTKQITIHASPEFVFRTSDDTILNYNDTAFFAAGTSLIVTVEADALYDSVVWADGTNGASITISDEGIYNANVYSKGCSTESRFNAVHTGHSGGGTEIMNLFTPNGDGFNDFWLVNNPDITFPIKVSIYNRSGRSVYSSDSYQNDWDGQSQGNPLPQATYYYIIQDAANQTFKGPVTIIR